LEDVRNVSAISHPASVFVAAARAAAPRRASRPRVICSIIVPNPSFSLTMWASEWLAGRAAPDDVVDALTRWAPMHLIVADDRVLAGAIGLAWPDPVDGGVTELLALLRSAQTAPITDAVPMCGPVELVLPVPGDLNGLDPRCAFTAAALDAGHGILVCSARMAPGDALVGLVPTVEGPDVLRWTVFAAQRRGVGAAALVTLGEAEFEMRQATRKAAEALVHLDLSGGRPGQEARARIVETLADLTMHQLPESIPARAARVFDSANQIEAIVTVALSDEAATPHSAAETLLRDELMRPLKEAVRQARLAAARACVAPGLTGG
jgi:hypothetical protein